MPGPVQLNTFARREFRPDGTVLRVDADAGSIDWIRISNTNNGFFQIGSSLPGSGVSDSNVQQSPGLSLPAMCTGLVLPSNEAAYRVTSNTGTVNCQTDAFMFPGGMIHASVISGEAP